MAPLTPQDVQAALDALGLNIHVQVFETSTATAQEAADSIGCELGAIVKSLCFLVDGKPVIVLTAGDRRADDRKMAALYEVGRKRVRMADFDSTVAATGYAPGGVPPVGHIQPLPVLIDDTLARFETVYCAAGSPNAIFPIAFGTLVEATGGRTADIAQE
jgi:prolyl-tRNA editing enzyme YbaK/EbsC (Cys-tRNA(Pro) deacylase)